MVVESLIYKIRTGDMNGAKFTLEEYETAHFAGTVLGLHPPSFSVVLALKSCV